GVDDEVLPEGLRGPRPEGAGQCPDVRRSEQGVGGRRGVVGHGVEPSRRRNPALGGKEAGPTPSRRGGILLSAVRRRVPRPHEGRNPARGGKGAGATPAQKGGIPPLGGEEGVPFLPPRAGSLPGTTGHRHPPVPPGGAVPLSAVRTA